MSYVRIGGWWDTVLALTLAAVVSVVTIHKVLEARIPPETATSEGEPCGCPAPKDTCATPCSTCCAPNPCPMSGPSGCAVVSSEHACREIVVGSVR